METILAKVADVPGQPIVAYTFPHVAWVRDWNNVLAAERNAQAGVKGFYNNGVIYDTDHNVGKGLVWDTPVPPGCVA